MKYTTVLFLFIAISSAHAAEYPSVREEKVAQLNRTIERAIYQQDKIESQLKKMGIRIENNGKDWHVGETQVSFTDNMPYFLRSLYTTVALYLTQQDRNNGHQLIARYFELLHEIVRNRHTLRTIYEKKEN